MKTLYGHTLYLTTDEGASITSWEYRDNRVMGQELVAAKIAPQSMGKVLSDIHAFMRALELDGWGVHPETAELTPGFKHAVEWETETVALLSIEIGDLSFSLSYDTTAMEYGLEQEAFDLSWSDFRYLLKHWQLFVDEVA